MANEENITKELTDKFTFLEGKLRVQRERRIFSESLDWAEFIQVFEYAVKQLNFSILTTITGMDEGDWFEAIYHLAKEDGTMFNLKARTPRQEPVLKTVTGYFPGAANYERELQDMFGIRVEGVPPGKRYPLPDDWPEGQHPLRKDWTADMLEGFEAGKKM